MNTKLWQAISAHIRQVTRSQFEGDRVSAVGGGCINEGYCLQQREGPQYFVKLNQAALVGMFAAEAAGLTQMAQTQTLTIPRPICWGQAEDNSYLVLEWLDFEGGSRQGWAAMGTQLAGMHRSVSGQGFGWQQNNTIGATPQANDWLADWAEFWQQRRIGPQLSMAQQRGGKFPLGERLLAAIPEILADHHPQPSLVHGDLWSGNAAIAVGSLPVIFDPAPYYGDREVDLAMTHLFGSFPAQFYQAYEAAWPLPQGHQRRQTLYNLYHILNHFNLFGGGYGSQANRMIEQLLD
jgi:fructosamine-3-kinase